jgi:biotin-dependent carboxylase-like uncharacterized protein
VIEIVRSAGFGTVQDQGWRVGRAIGLPRSGALDPTALRLANALVGNEEGEAGLELALGSFDLSFREACAIALAGAQVRATLAGAPVPGATTLTVRPGDRLVIERFDSGRFGYLAVSGGIDVPPLLGSRSTYLPTALGGAGGRRLRSGDLLPIGRRAGRLPPHGTSAPDTPIDFETPIRIAPAPQVHLFDPAARATLEAGRFTVSPASDRMGTRLAGPPIAPTIAAASPSEATCLGAIQVPDNGQPIVLLADGPTVGGYPKIAAVIGADLGRFVQISPGGSVRFEWVTVADAQRAWAEAVEKLARRLTAARLAGRPA